MLDLLHIARFKMSRTFESNEWRSDEKYLKLSRDFTPDEDRECVKSEDFGVEEIEGQKKKVFMVIFIT